MAKLGSPRTRKTRIGTSEVRVGPLSLANKLTQSHSIGVVDNVTIEVAQETLDLEAGFPKLPIDTAIIKQNASITATLREYSRRNLKLMMGEGVSAVPVTDVATTLTANETLGQTSIDVTSITGITAGMLVGIYPAARPEELSVCRVDSAAANVVTLDANTPTLFAYNGASETVHMYALHPVAIGAVSQANYFTVQILRQDRQNGRPVGYNFWKAAIGSGMTDAGNADDFSSTDLNIKILVPAASEYDVGGDMAHLAEIIPQNPVGMYFGGADDA